MPRLSEPPLNWNEKSESFYSTVCIGAPGQRHCAGSTDSQVTPASGRTLTGPIGLRMMAMIDATPRVTPPVTARTAAEARPAPVRGARLGTRPALRTVGHAMHSGFRFGGKKIFQIFRTLFCCKLLLCCTCWQQQQLLSVCLEISVGKICQINFLLLVVLICCCFEVPGRSYGQSVM